MHAFFVRQRLSALLDGELPAHERDAMLAALADDAELRRDYEAMRMAVALLGRVGPVPAPAALAEAVLVAQTERPARPPWPLLLGGLTLLGAGVVFWPDAPRPSAPDALEALHEEIAAAPIEVAVIEPEDPEPEDPEPVDPEPVVAEPVVHEPVVVPPAPTPRPKPEREAYQAAWERGSQLARVRSVRMHASRGDVLYELTALAAEHGGLVASGQARMLDSEQAYGQLTLTVPADRLEGFMAGLGDLGSLTSALPRPAEDGEETIEVVVEVQLH